MTVVEPNNGGAISPLSAMSTMVTELAVPLRGSKLRAASRREVRAMPHVKLTRMSFFCAPTVVCIACN